jgi:TolB-like protein
VKCITVEPFTDVGAHAHAEEFARGLTDEIIHALASNGVCLWEWQWDRILSTLPACDATEQPHIFGVLRGSVRMANTDVRVSAHLVEDPTGTVVWSQVYSGNLTDIFATQESIATAIAAAIQDTISCCAPRTGASRSAPELPQAFAFFTTK